MNGWNWLWWHICGHLVLYGTMIIETSAARFLCEKYACNNKYNTLTNFMLQRKHIINAKCKKSSG